MKRNGLWAILVFSLAGMVLCTSCGGPDGKKSDGNGDSFTGNISISGAFALYPMTVRWAEEFRKLHPGVTIDISAGGAGKGMADALSGMVDLGMFSRDVSPEEEAKGAWWIPVTRDAVLPTINATNPDLQKLKSQGLTKDQFSALFIENKKLRWADLTGSNVGSHPVLFTRSDACGAAEMWAKYLGKKQDDLLGIGVFGDPGMADAIRNDANGLGFNNLNYVFDCKTGHLYPGLEIIPLDMNNNRKIDPEEHFYQNMDSLVSAIQTGRFPSPPSRDLFFVSKGKPTNPLVLAFLRWILEDGQKFVKEAGYVSLTPEKREAAHKTIE